MGQWQPQEHTDQLADHEADYGCDQERGEIADRSPSPYVKEPGVEGAQCQSDEDARAATGRSWRNDAAAEAEIPVVEDRALAGRDAALGDVEFDANRTVSLRM